MPSPLITVLMPVYNGGKYLREAIDSILNQTFIDFEFLIIDDGSTDNSTSIIDSYDDRRIHLIANDTNQGIVTSLNRGIDSAKGMYIARMDSDDISLPHRLLTQLEFMEEHQEVGVCGSGIRLFGADHGDCYNPSSHNEIIAWMLFKCAMYHPTVIIKKSILTKNSTRYKKSYRAEDYELWSRLLYITKFANIDSVLLLYRTHASSLSHSNRRKLQKSAAKVRHRFLNQFPVTTTADEVLAHNSLTCYQFDDDIQYFYKLKEWLEKLHALNDTNGTYEKGVFSKVLEHYWFRTCHFYRKHNYTIIFHYFSSTIKSSGSGLTLPEVKFIFSSLLYTTLTKLKGSSF